MNKRKRYFKSKTYGFWIHRLIFSGRWLAMRILASEKYNYEKARKRMERLWPSLADTN